MTPTPEALEAAREIAEGLRELFCVEPVHNDAQGIAARRITTALTDFAARAVEGEREACAGIADEHKKATFSGMGEGTEGQTAAGRLCAESIATAIRARGSEKP